jgi:hypothetical protein
MTAAQTATSSAALPGIRAGDLDQPGLPQDALGRALLIVAIALLADLFVPWRYVYGQHETLPVAGGVALAALIAVAAAPSLHPKLRRHPIATALPMLTGALNLGLGAAFWVYLAHSNDVANTIVTDIPPTQSVPASTSASSVVVGPDFGLFCFLVGSAVLIVIGYYLFLAAARAFAQSAVQVTPATTPAGAPPPASGRVESAAALPTPPAPPTVIAHGASNATGTAAASNANNSRATPTPLPIALPGSEAWNRATEPPAIIRPKAGGIRRSGSHR